MFYIIKINIGLILKIIQRYEFVVNKDTLPSLYIYGVRGSILTQFTGLNSLFSVLVREIFL